MVSSYLGIVHILRCMCMSTGMCSFPTPHCSEVPSALCPARGLPAAGLWSLNATSEQLTLAFPSALPVSELTLLIRFNYTLSEGLSGFYRSTYKGALPSPLSSPLFYNASDESWLVPLPWGLRARHPAAITGFPCRH